MLILISVMRYRCGPLQHDPPPVTSILVVQAITFNSIARELVVGNLALLINGFSSALLFSQPCSYLTPLMNSGVMSSSKMLAVWLV